MKTSTIFFGASSYVLSLIAFLQKEYDLRLVITTEFSSSDPVPLYCQKNAISCLSVKKLDEEIIEKIREQHATFAVLADFRLLIKQPILDMFPKGIINIHPSLLPEYRGPTPGTTAILDGKKQTGVSLMLLDKELDHGFLLGQEIEHILPTDTSVTLYEKLFAKGVSLLGENLPKYLNGQLKPVQQNQSKATYTEYLVRNSGFIDVTHIPTRIVLDRMIRAYFPWPGVWTTYELSGTLKGKIIKFLPEGKIQVEGKKAVSYKDFLNGYPEARSWLEKILQ